MRDDPRSSNQTLGGSGTRKSIGLDMAYVDWKFMQGGNLLLGKQVNPIFRPGQSLFYDGDYNPEGGAVKFDRGMFFGSAYGWWLTEQYNANPDGENTDADIFGLQAGMKFPLFGGETVLAANYYECGACQGQLAAVRQQRQRQHDVRVGTSTTNRLTYGYDILEIGAQIGFTAPDLPLTFWANYAQNMANDVEYDTAYAIGAMVGKASNAKTWEAGLFYQELDKDALFGQWIDSDFGDGRTDSEGWVLKGGYAPVRNFTVNATYFMNTLNKDVGVGARLRPPAAGPELQVLIAQSPAESLPGPRNGPSRRRRRRREARGGLFFAARLNLPQSGASCTNRQLRESNAP